MSVSDLYVPRPVPAKYMSLDERERDWHGRACVALLDAGFAISTAWRMSLSADPRWAAFAKSRLATVTDTQLEVLSLRRWLGTFVEED